MKLRFLLPVLLIASAAFSQTNISKIENIESAVTLQNTIDGNGIITGVLTDKDYQNSTLAFAFVSVKGTSISATTDIDGKYSLALKPGNYIIQFTYADYEAIEVKISLTANETKTINKALGSGSKHLEEVVIRSSRSREKETALLLEQKQAVVIKQSIGAQEMSRKGVSDVEEGLTKITGITKVGSRGLFVRGLEDRYNNILINDLSAPTNNPFLKIIPLDLFPTNIVGAIDVYKTFNPNLYGDFAGGTFNIQTTKATKSLTRLNLGVGYTTNNSMQDFLISADAKNTGGFWGFNGKDRQLPEIFGSVPSNKTLTSQESLNSFKSGFNASQTKSPLNSSINFFHAERFNLKKNRNIAYLLSLNFDNSFSIRSGADRTIDLQTTGSKYVNDFITTDYRYKTASSFLTSINYDASRFKLDFNLLYINTTMNSIKDQFGILNSNVGEPNHLIRTNQLDKSGYLNTQLLGEYALSKDNNQNIRAGVSFANTKYEQPDRKFFGGTKINDTDISTAYGGSNFLRQYLTVDGNSYYSAFAEYNLKFGDAVKKQNKLTFGYNGNGSSMESSYRFVSTVSFDPGFTTNINNIDTKLNQDLTNDVFSYKESSNATYKVLLKEFANAAYTNLLLKFDDKFEINGGVRIENTMRQTQYRPLGSFTDPFKKKNYDNLYVLPSLNAKYLLNEKSNFRFAASKTYTRPVIMESFPISYINADGTSTQGNSLLKNSDNINTDLKYEIFPTSREMFAVGIFGKHIVNPIERTYVSNATTGTVTTYLNSNYANLFGIETEFILGLKRISDNLSDFSFGVNASLMSTNVKVKPTYESEDENGVITTKPSIETHQSRALQGASNWLVNSDLKYEFKFNKSWSNTVSLVYGVFGKRIFAVGTNGQDNTYEIPYQQLDFVWSSKISEHFDLKFTADNLLNPARNLEFGNNGTIHIAEQSLIANSYKKGVGFSLKLGYTF